MFRIAKINLASAQVRNVLIQGGNNRRRGDAVKGGVKQRRCQNELNHVSDLIRPFSFPKLSADGATLLRLTFSIPRR